MIEIFQITEGLREKYNNELLNFECNFTYPFGEDYFTISHGNNYFKFFDSLGTPFIFAATYQGSIGGIIVLILKNIVISKQGEPEPIWYICDLKIHQEYRGKGIIQKFYSFAFESCSKISKKIYGVSMNSGLKENKLSKLAARIPFISIKEQGVLFFYLLDKSQFNIISPLLKQFFMGFGYLSLRGIKDLIMNSSKQPLPLVHIIPNNEIVNNIDFTKDNYFIFNVFSINPLTLKLQQMGILPVSTATILSNITNCDWNFIHTYEI